MTATSYPFSSLTLLSWDYSVTDRQAALAQSAGITISFRVRSSFRHVLFHLSVEATGVKV